MAFHRDRAQTLTHNPLKIISLAPPFLILSRMNLLPLENCPRTNRARSFRKPLTSATGRRSRRCSINWKPAPRSAKSAAELERWLLDWSELNAALDEESSRRYIAMTCHTDNADAEKAYLHFVENIEPQLKPRQFALEKIYVTHPLREMLTMVVPNSCRSLASGEK